jgi:hypothetical protein
MNLRQQQTNLKPAPSFTPVQAGILQRKCACGNHTIAGGECTACAKNKSGFQRKLAIGASHDPLEQEADRVTDQVTAASAHSAVSGAPPYIQRYAGQATEGTETAPASVDRVLASLGRPMEPVLRQDMEQRFGRDFSQVRVHSGTAAEQSARDVNAHAYTVGHKIVFGAGQFAPGTHEGRRLIAHELTHFLQQMNAARTGEIELAESNNALGKKADTVAPQPYYGSTLDATAAGTRLVLSRKDKQPPAPETEDCSDEQTKMLKSHLDDARTWVNAASPKVASYAYFNVNPRVTAVPKNPQELDKVRDALRDNFHTTKDGVLSIKDGFQELQTALNSSITYECEDDGCTDQAYVRGAFAAIRRAGDIHVCPPWFNCKDYYRRVTTLIHERAHQYPGATDNAYEWEGSYATLSSDDAIDNAESYAVAARQIYHGGSRGPGMPAC